MKKGFTLIELMISIGVVGILATIAIPQYNHYVAKAQVTECIVALEYAKSVSLAEFAEKGVFPTTAELYALIPNNATNKLKETNYLNLITTDKSSSKKSFDINLRLKKERLNSQIANKHLTLRYTYANQQWTCLSEDILQANLPSACIGVDKLKELSDKQDKEDKEKSNNGNHYGQIKNGD